MRVMSGKEMTAPDRAGAGADQSQHVDVAIIGAGPAGSTAARQLALWGHSVALIGRRPRRALAESLPPSCTKLFDRLGVHEAIDQAQFIRAPGNTVQWAGQPRRVELFEPGVFGYQVSRDRLDALLVDSARGAGAEVIEDAVVRDVERDCDDWLIRYTRGAAIHAVRAPWVLDCSGRSGVIAKRGLRDSTASVRTTAIVGVWESAGPWPTDDDTHTLVESYDGGWAWSVPVSLSRRFVTVMLDPKVSEVPARSRLPEAYRAELAHTRMVGSLVQAATLVELPWGCDASPYGASEAARDGALLVGDAASFVDPLSSFGVKKALASAWLASVAVHTCLLDSMMMNVAFDFFSRREREMYEQLQRQSASLSREAAGAYASEFWRGRVDGAIEELPQELDEASLRSDQRISDAFEELKRRSSVRLRGGDSLRIIERPTVRGNRIVLDKHLVARGIPNGARYFRNVDLVVIAELASQYDQVPDLFDAYNAFTRAAPPAPLPDFLGALSMLIGLDALPLA
jgi:flavin-dependent dehydrogenase